jgi:hypothetical protein
MYHTLLVSHDSTTVSDKLSESLCDIVSETRNESKENKANVHKNTLALFFLFN